MTTALPAGSPPMHGAPTRAAAPCRRAGHRTGCTPHHAPPRSRCPRATRSAQPEPPADNAAAAAPRYPSGPPALPVHPRAPRAPAVPRHRRRRRNQRHDLPAARPSPHQRGEPQRQQQHQPLPSWYLVNHARRLRHTVRAIDNNLLETRHHRSARLPIHALLLIRMHVHFIGVAGRGMGDSRSRSRTADTS